MNRAPAPADPSTPCTHRAWPCPLSRCRVFLPDQFDPGEVLLLQKPNNDLGDSLADDPDAAGNHREKDAQTEDILLSDARGCARNQLSKNTRVISNPVYSKVAHRRANLITSLHHGKRCSILNLSPGYCRLSRRRAILRNSAPHSMAIAIANPTRAATTVTEITMRSGLVTARWSQGPLPSPV